MIFLLESLQVAPISVVQIQQWTARDAVLSKVLQFLLQGWPLSVDDADLLTYLWRRDELSVQDGCILWGARVVVPKPGQESIIRLLHETHPGITRMKGLARTYVWWPGVDADLENQVRQCTS